MPRIDLIAGARPNFMKVAPIIRAIQSRPELGLRFRLVHTGQHYDRRMSGDFFDQLGLPDPDANLGVGSGTQAEQTGAIMRSYEALLAGDPSDLCLVVGDVTSTMACAVVARKAGVPVAHVEAGIRSGDWSMPEEVNRVVTDAVTNYFFTTSEVANAHLRAAGVPDERVFFVGNTMIDTLLAQRSRFQTPEWWPQLALRDRSYFVLTLHRPANVDSAGQLQALMQAIVDGAGDVPVVFPVHPRTAAMLRTLPALPGTVHVVEPQPYLEFGYLVSHAMGVVTDSGGVTEETTVLGIPCLTLRDNTERPETVTMGTNELIGTDPTRIPPAMARVRAGQWKTGAVPPLWDGRTGERIVDVLAVLLDARGHR